MAKPIIKPKIKGISKDKARPTSAEEVLAKSPDAAGLAAPPKRRAPAFCITLPAEVGSKLDNLAAARFGDNRSKAIAAVLKRSFDAGHDYDYYIS